MYFVAHTKNLFIFANADIFISFPAFINRSCRHIAGVNWLLLSFFSSNLELIAIFSQEWGMLCEKSQPG